VVMGTAAGLQGQGATIRLGSRVRVKDGDAEVEFTIVGPEDADAMQGLISEDSPMARALLGRRAGESVTVPRRADRWPVTIAAVTGPL